MSVSHNYTNKVHVYLGFRVPLEFVFLYNDGCLILQLVNAMKTVGEFEVRKVDFNL